MISYKINFAVYFYLFNRYIAPIRGDVSKCHQSSIVRLRLSFKNKYLAPFNTLLHINGIRCNLKKDKTQTIVKLGIVYVQ